MGRKATGSIIETTTAEGVTYSARFRAGGKKRCQRLGSTAEGFTRAHAETELAYLLAQVQRGDWKAPAPAPAVDEPRTAPTFHQFASRWFAAQKIEGGRQGTGLTPNGAADLEWRLTSHLLPAFAGKRLDEITVEHIDTWRMRKVAEGHIGTTSINKCLQTLSAIMEQAVDYGHVDRKPKIKRLPSVTPRRTHLDRAEHIAALLDAAGRLDARATVLRGHRRALIATLTFAGLRSDEALSLRWEDVDLARGVITVHGTKTDAAERTVNVLPVLRDEMVTWAARGRHDDKAFVFGTSTGGKQTNTNVRRRLLLPAVADASAVMVQAGGQRLPEGLTLHSLRRTFASLLYALGETPVYVKNQMGHETPDLALAIYAHDMDRRDGEQERLQALVNGQVWTSPLDPVPNVPQRQAA